jgi:hypothetical protein
MHSIKPDMNNNLVEVKLDVRTRMGKLIIPMTFGDHGSVAANEKQAFVEFRAWLGEARQALDSLEE